MVSNQKTSQQSQLLGLCDRCGACSAMSAVGLPTVLGSFWTSNVCFPLPWTHTREQMLTANYPGETANYVGALATLKPMK